MVQQQRNDNARLSLQSWMVADRPDERLGQLLVLDRICYLGRVAPRGRIGRIQRGSGWDANRFFWISSAPCWRRYFAPLPPVCRDAPAPCTKGTSQFMLLHMRLQKSPQTTGGVVPSSGKAQGNVAQNLISDLSLVDLTLRACMAAA
jgi:hypothetical protein